MKTLFKAAVVLLVYLVVVADSSNDTDNSTVNNTRPCNYHFTETAFYPKEVFTECQIQDGAVVFHVIGMLYMFVALALICDEFFVPALEVIIATLGISDDVAGATFMAAGGSAPEFFTSVIGVFISESQVGVGTIIGSAVFNVLFVIGMCAVFSKELLTLTWWPLFRDVSFYCIGLCILIGSFIDFKVHWYEALLLFIWYLCYVCFMKFNENVESFVKGKVALLANRNKPKESAIDESLKNIFNPEKANLGSHNCACQSAKKNGSAVRQVVPVDGDEQQNVLLDKNGDTEAGKDNGGDAVEVLIKCENPECLNSRVTQYPTLALCATVLDPVSQASFNDRVTDLQRLQKIKPTSKRDRSFSRVSIATLREHRFSRSTLFKPMPPVNHTGTASGNNLNTLVRSSSGSVASPKSLKSGSMDNGGNLDHELVQIESVEPATQTKEEAEEKPEEVEEEKEEPLDLSWPDTWRSRFVYVLLAPILFPLALTTPDVRKPRWRRFFPITFLFSILWIAVFSYLMVWWTETLGRTIGLGDKPEVMGMTLIAAGTSVPDLITSVIVARKGLGDMAVSSSIGSNLFDICVGLPVPWMIGMAAGTFSATENIVNVDSEGMFCSVIMLFAMLIAIIIIIAICKWKMTKILGGSMFVGYFIYLTLALMMALGLFSCPFDSEVIPAPA
jgi:K+-dependent Na+/Ca+ exchanger-like protein